MITKVMHKIVQEFGWSEILLNIRYIITKKKKLDILKQDTQ